MHNNLNRYRIGLGVIGIFSLILVGIVLVQAGTTRTDNNTTKTATKIVDKLDSYITDHNKIPSSLADAKVSDVPDTISYQKVSSISYKFCVTYKAASSGFDATQAVENVATGGVGSSDDYYDASDNSSYLYIPSTHDKGRRCQTIKPYLQSDDNYNYSTSKDTTDDPRTNAIASGGQDTVCYLSGYASHYAGKITAIASSDGKPITPTVKQDVVLTIEPIGNTASGTQSVTLTSTSYNVFTSTCYSLSHQAIKVGDYVSVFQNSNQGSLTAVVDFSRSY